MNKSILTFSAILLVLGGCAEYGEAPGRLVAPRLTMSGPKLLPQGERVHQRGPAVAFGGGLYLVVWQDGYNAAGGNSDIVGIRVDQSGRAIDTTPIAICRSAGVQEAPSVAFCEGRFLVAWADRRGGADYDVYRTSVTPDGRVWAKDGELLAGGRGAQTCPTVATNGGDQFLVAWQDMRNGEHFTIYAARIAAATGEDLDRDGFVVMDRGEQPVAVWTGENYAVCQKWYAALVGADGKVQMPVKQLWNSKVSSWCSAASAWGKAFAFLITEPYPDPWGWGGNGSTVGVSLAPDGASPEREWASKLRDLQAAEADSRVVNCLDAAQWRNHPGWPMGMRGGLKGTRDDVWPSGRTAAAFNRRSLVVVWTRAHLVDNRRLANRDLYLTRVLPDWGLVDRPPVKLVAGGTEESNPVLCAGRPGQTLLAYEKVVNAGVSIEYRVLTEAEDRDPPKVLYVVPQSDGEWIVAFDEPIDAASVKTAAFAIEGLVVQSAALNGDARGLGREAVLTMAQPPVREKAYVLRVTGVKDRSPAANATTGDSVPFIAKPGRMQRGDFIDRWAVLGAFDRDVDKHPIDVKTVRPSPGDAGPNGSGTQWAAADRPVLDLDGMFDGKNEAMIYANTYVYSDRPRTVVLRIDTNDHNRVWVNGKLVHDDITGATGSRGFHDSTDQVEIRLELGWNQLLVQVDNWQTTWAMSAQIADRPDGEPVGGLTWQTDDPAK